MNEIKTLIKNYNNLNNSTLLLLKSVVSKYPFFQTARLLYLANLYVLHHPDFDKELKKGAVMISDRNALFALTEGIHYSQDSLVCTDKTVDTQNQGDRTSSLINNFLKKSPREENVHSAQGQADSPSIVDLTTDYASYLSRQDDSGKERIPQLRGQQWIDQFIEETKGKQRVEIPDYFNEEGETEQNLSGNGDQEIYTESMVNIYIQQGKYKPALEILKRICLNNPKKSAYFANQMRLLEIIINDERVED